MAEQLVHDETPMEYFKQLVEGALEHQRVQSSEHTTFYVVNLLAAFVCPQREAADPLRPLLDADVADAARALAATYETSARGVIYEHQTQSLPAQRLVTGLQAALADLSRDGRERLVEREAPHALRALERGVRAAAALPGSSRTAFLELAARVLAPGAGGDARPPDARAPAAHPGLILPPD